LIEADAGTPVGESAQLASVQRIGGRRGIEYQEIIAEPLHLQKLDAHTGAA
jgi:hypothetical protein